MPGKVCVKTLKGFLFGSYNTFHKCVLAAVMLYSIFNNTQVLLKDIRLNHILEISLISLGYVDF